MALTILDPQVAQVIGESYMEGRNARTDSSKYQLLAKFVIDGLSDSAATAPSFDTSHEVFNSFPLNSASQDATFDNTNGAVPTLVASPTLSYSYTQGHSTTHDEAKGFTATVTQDFDFKFAGAGEGTTLSASGSFNWSSGTSDDQTTTVTSSETVTFDVPAGKAIEAKLISQQLQVQVPYSWAATMTGDYKYTYTDGVDTFTFGAGNVFWNAQSTDRNGPLLPAPDGVDWGKFVGAYENVFYTLTGTMTVNGASKSNVKLYDVTNGSTQEVQSRFDSGMQLGVHRVMDDAGRRLRDTPFDDWVDGGDGDDRILLSGGDDIVHAGAGSDTMVANGAGRMWLEGGDGADLIRLTSDVAFSYLAGGAGDDRIHVDAPAAMLNGGTGNDRYRINGAHAGGTVISDSEGQNRLHVDAGCAHIAFERVIGSDNLYILVGGDTYDRSRDVVWLDFFANPNNRVDGLTTKEIEEISSVYRPGHPVPQEVLDTLPGVEQPPSLPLPANDAAFA